MNPKLPESLWAATAGPARPYPVLADELKADAAVIGAGFTGLSAALHLAERGLRPVVVDAAEPGWGASGRNGGQVIAGLKHDPEKLEALFGSDLGARMVAAMGGSADLVFSLIDKHDIDCHAVRSGWIQAAHGRKPFEELVVPRCRQWQARGVPAKLLNRAETAAMIGCRPDAYFGAWYDSRGGVLQPLCYARGLAAAAERHGAAIYSRSPARRLVRDGSHWRLEAGGGTIRAPKVILATNAYTDGLWPGLRRTVVPVSSFQIATKPVSDHVRGQILPGGQGVADTRRLLLYFRFDHTGRFVMGGRSPVEDHPTIDDAGQLRRTLRTLFPAIDADAIDYVWSGKVAITKDGLPHLHVLAPGLLAALGCNGRGVGMCTVMGKLLAELAIGDAPETIPFPVTAPQPFALHGFRKVGVIALAQYYRLLDRLEAAI